MAKKRTKASSEKSTTKAVKADKKPDPSKHRYALKMFQSGNSKDPYGTVSYQSFCRIQELMDSIPLEQKDETTIDVWIDSPGGSASMAFKSVLEIRNKCSVCNAVVGDFAKSAATLMLLGMNNVWMQASSELGPLDVQVEHPDREGTTVSGLDTAKSLGFLNEFAIEFVLASGNDILAMTKLPREKVLDALSSFSAKLLEPILSKLDPQLIHRSANDLDLAKRYAVKLLYSVGHDRKQAENIAHQLVEHYPAHEFLISRDEAKDLGLPVFSAEEYLCYEDFVSEFRKFRKKTFRIQQHSEIELVKM